MSYNYARTFLEGNAELVRELIRLADENAYTTWEGPPEKLARLRHRISNLLASLAYHIPNKAYVRAALHTWITRAKSGTMQLNVGVPPAGVSVRGRPSDITGISRAAAPHDDVVPNDAPYNISTPITDNNWLSIGGQVIEARKSGRALISLTGPLDPGFSYKDFIDTMFESQGYARVSDTPPTFKLKE